jgi:hypothetical protein
MEGGVDHRVHIGGRDEMGGGCISALSAGSYIATLYVMVTRVKGGGVHPPTLTSQG